MAKEINSLGGGFLVDGTIPDLPRVPEGLLDHNVILEEGARRGEEAARREENERKIVAEIDQVTSPWGPKLFAMATKRLEHGLFEPKKRRKKEKTSKWEGSWEKGWENRFNKYALVFEANWRQSRVEDVKNFRMDKSGKSVTIVVEGGKVSEVAYEFESEERPFWKKKLAPPPSTEWDDWFEGVVNKRGIRNRAIEAGVHKDYPRVKEKLTFVTSKPAIKYSAFYDPNKKFAVYFGGVPPKEPLDEVSDLWNYNSDKDRFNHLYDEHLETHEELEERAGAYKETNPELAAFIIESGLQNPIEHGLIYPTEFTRGLELLLDTIPLYKL